MTDVWEERKKGLEEEYFHRKEQEALEKARQRLAAEELERQRAGSVLRCPKCDARLEEVSFQEIQVDRCTGCQGVWLDPGELERVTARETQGWLTHVWRRFGR
ncbi:MAG TPA: zf-TFIIB domain-containing protein [Methylomirabilota bacterium]|nr:zf-TFIIB domain-containing protein [Methylomirabilota bacterium]